MLWCRVTFKLTNGMHLVKYFCFFFRFTALMVLFTRTLNTRLDLVWFHSTSPISYHYQPNLINRDTITQRFTNDLRRIWNKRVLIYSSLCSIEIQTWRWRERERGGGRVEKKGGKEDDIVKWASIVMVRLCRVSNDRWVHSNLFHQIRLQIWIGNNMHKSTYINDEKEARDDTNRMILMCSDCCEWFGNVLLMFFQWDRTRSLILFVHRFKWD